jgi:hypothetical protein
MLKIKEKNCDFQRFQNITSNEKTENILRCRNDLAGLMSKNQFLKPLKTIGHTNSSNSKLIKP